MKIGYARVSSKDQNERRQVDALQAAGAQKIFLDKESGKDFNREQYLKMRDSLTPGGLLIISSIDRLGRNYTEIQDQWRVITRNIEADILVLDMPLLDTRKGKDLMGTFVADLVLQVLAFVAEQERRNIKYRQAQGIAAARARGVHLGRKPAPLPENFTENMEQWAEKKLSGSEAARRCGMPLSSFLIQAKKAAYIRWRDDYLRKRKEMRG